MTRLPRRYVVGDDPRSAGILDQIERQGLSAEFWALYGELQFAPRDPSLGVRDFVWWAPDSHIVRIGGFRLVYAVHEEPPTLALSDLIPTF